MDSDMKAITKTVKSWLYQDLYVRPLNQALYKPTSSGGLGLIHIELHCQALIIRSFLETSINPNFKKSFTNTELFLQKVLGEESNFHVEFSPSYNEKFLSLIRIIMKMATSNIGELSLRHIYELILDHNLLKGLDNLPIPLYVAITLPWLN